MPTYEVYTVTLDGSQMDNFQDSAVSLILYGSVSLYRVRAKKSNSGKFAFNVEATASKTNKFSYTENLILDYNPNQIRDQYADGDDLTTALNAVDGADITTPDDNPKWKSSGTNITSYPTTEIDDNEYFYLGSAMPTFAAGEPFSIAMVVDESDHLSKTLIGSNVGNSSSASIYGNNSSRQLFMQDESGNTITGTDNSEYIGDSDIRVMIRDTSDVVSEYKRGTLSAGTGGSKLSGAFTPEYLGASKQSKTWSYGTANISRLIVCNEAWDSDTRQLVEGWLAYEYGLQTAGGSYLPTGHDYKAASPITSLSYSYTSDIDLDSLAVDTWSSSVAPNNSAINGELSIVPTKAYKAGTVTIELTIQVN